MTMIDNDFLNGLNGQLAAIPSYDRARKDLKDAIEKARAQAILDGIGDQYESDKAKHKAINTAVREKTATERKAVSDYVDRFDSFMNLILIKSAGWTAIGESDGTLTASFNGVEFLRSVGVIDGDGELSARNSAKIDKWVGRVTRQGKWTRKGLTLIYKVAKDDPTAFILAIALGLFESGAFDAIEWTENGRLVVRTFEEVESA